MVERLARGPASVSELARPFDMSLPTVVQHLGVLETAGIVTSTKVGRVRTYQLVTEALTPAAEWISGQRLPAERALDRLGAFLSDHTDKETDAGDIIERSEVRDVRHRTQLPVPVSAVWHPFRQRRLRPVVRGRQVRPRESPDRVGGHGVETSGTAGHVRFVSAYTDIVDQQRMVFVYDIWVERHMSPR
jgi:DNA-binding transcriptional ArsR family regulator